MGRCEPWSGALSSAVATLWGRVQQPKSRRRDRLASFGCAAAATKRRDSGRLMGMTERKDIKLIIIKKREADLCGRIRELESINAEGSRDEAGGRE